ncbi:MAG: Gfo/Idh/MocA family oxidoreductase [Candidatus Hydrogenedentota bacterium]
MDDHSKVRVGVIGVGHLGSHHARLYAAAGNVDLVGVFDTDSARAADAAERFSTRAFDSLDALLAERPDAVSVAVPTLAHHDVTLAALEAGADVLVEKPIAANGAEGSAMVEAARARGRVLQVGHVERFNGAVMALMESISGPRFIECHRLSPYPNRGHDVSVVHDLMIHDLDIVLALAGHEIESIDAIGVAVFSEAEDIANARIRFRSGCVANLTASRVSVERMRKIRIFEPNAYVSTDYSAQEVLVYRKKPGPLPEGASPMEAITIEPLEVVREEPLKLEIEAFLECVRTRSTPRVSGEDGLRALRLAEDLIAFMRART